MTKDEARQWLLSLFPPGFENLYDLAPGVGDLYQLMDAFGQTFKSYAFDTIDTLRREIFPQSTNQKLTDWEAATGISNLAPAIFGTVAQRQAALVAKLREFGPFSDPVVQSIIGPLLGYFSTTVPQILKASRSALNTAHTYTGAGFDIGPVSAADSAPIRTHDGGVVSKAGARVTITFAAPLPALVTFLLNGPAGQQVAVVIPAGVTTYTAFVVGSGIVGTQIGNPDARQGWFLLVVNASVSSVSVTSWSLLIEGIGPNEETGGAIFAWGVYADPVHLGENGIPADFTAARNGINRVEHSHTHGSLILAIAPASDAAGAIPDAFVPG